MRWDRLIVDSGKEERKGRGGEDRKYKVKIEGAAGGLRPPDPPLGRADGRAGRQYFLGGGDDKYIQELNNI